MIAIENKEKEEETERERKLKEEQARTPKHYTNMFSKGGKKINKMA